MIELAYISNATVEFAEPELVELLKTCHQTNESLSVTGLLVYNGRGTFIQMLEGEENSVRDLYKKIKKDPRHKRVTCIGSKKINQRTYPDWKMGFRNLAQVPVHNLKGYSDFMSDKHSDDLELQSNFASAIFSHFKKNSRELIF